MSLLDISKQTRKMGKTSFLSSCRYYIYRSFQKEVISHLAFFLSFAGLVRTREAVPGGD